MSKKSIPWIIGGVIAFLCIVGLVAVPIVMVSRDTGRKKTGTGQSEPIVLENKALAEENLNEGEEIAAEPSSAVENGSEKEKGEKKTEVKTDSQPKQTTPVASPAAPANQGNVTVAPAPSVQPAQNNNNQNNPSSDSQEKKENKSEEKQIKVEEDPSEGPRVVITDEPKKSEEKKSEEKKSEEKSEEKKSEEKSEEKKPEDVTPPAPSEEKKDTAIELPII